MKNTAGADHSDRDDPNERLHVAGPARQTMRAHAERDAPVECCGLLIGSACRVDSAWPARNGSQAPERRYDLDPRDHFAAIRYARERGLSVIGAYHSHPRSAPLASAEDRAAAFADFVYLIIGRAPDGSWTMSAFRLNDGNFDELSLVFEA